MLIQYPISSCQWLIWSSLQQYLNIHIFFLTVPFKMEKRYYSHFVAGMRLSPVPKDGQEMCKRCGAQEGGNPCLRVLPSWVSLLFYRNMESYPGAAAQTMLVCLKKLEHIPPPSVALGVCPVNSARSHVPLPLDSLAPKCHTSTFPSTELFLSY